MCVFVGLCCCKVVGSTTRVVYTVLPELHSWQYERVRRHSVSSEVCCMFISRFTCLGVGSTSALGDPACRLRFAVCMFVGLCCCNVVCSTNSSGIHRVA